MKGDCSLDVESAVAGHVKVWSPIRKIGAEAILLEHREQVEFPEASIKGSLKLTDEFSVTIFEAASPVIQNVAIIPVWSSEDCAKVWMLRSVMYYRSEEVHADFTGPGGYPKAHSSTFRSQSVSRRRLVPSHNTASCCAHKR